MPYPTGVYFIFCLGASHPAPLGQLSTLRRVLLPMDEACILVTSLNPPLASPPSCSRWYGSSSCACLTYNTLALGPCLSAHHHVSSIIWVPPLALKELLTWYNYFQREIDSRDYASYMLDGWISQLIYRIRCLTPLPSLKHKMVTFWFSVEEKKLWNVNHVLTPRLAFILLFILLMGHVWISLGRTVGCT